MPATNLASRFPIPPIKPGADIQRVKGADMASLYTATGTLCEGPYKHAKIERLIKARRAKWVIKGVSAQLIHQNDEELAKERIEQHTVSGDRKWSDSMLPTHPYAASLIAKHQAIRRERIANAVGCHSVSEWEAVLDKFGRKCLRCEIPEEHTEWGRLAKDHVVPLASGGTDYASNLQPLCKRCNSWKGNREIDFRNKIT